MCYNREREWAADLSGFAGAAPVRRASLEHAVGDLQPILAGWNRIWPQVVHHILAGEAL